MLLKRYTALALVLLFLWALTPVAQGESQFWQCPGCSQWNSQSYQFCPHCGTQRPTYRQCPNCHYQTTDTAYTYCPVCGTVLQTLSGVLPTATPQPYIYGHTIDRLSTRSGPSTDFTGTGTYQVKDQDVPIFSVAYDVNGVAWVQCEVSYGGALRRVYTGLKRFDATTVDLSKVRAESSYTEAQRPACPIKRLYAMDQAPNMASTCRMRTRNRYWSSMWRTVGHRYSPPRRKRPGAHG